MIQKHGPYFTIEGNIGCGKSTILNIFKEHFKDFLFLDEPVERWRHVGKKLQANGKYELNGPAETPKQEQQNEESNNQQPLKQEIPKNQALKQSPAPTNKHITNVLQLYYNKPTVWGLSFLTYALFTRIDVYANTARKNPEKTIISQRSCLSDKFVFFELMKDLKYLTPTEANLFVYGFDELNRMQDEARPKIIYLRSTPKVCQERTNKRSREEESKIPLEYFEKLHVLHEKWMEMEHEKDVFVIDTSIEFENDKERIEEIIKGVTEFIQRSSPK